MADDSVTSSSVTPHPFVSALERVTATFKSSMQRMGDEVRSLKSKIETLEQEQRSTPALATQPTFDTDALVAQVAARVPPPDIAAIVTRAVAEIPVPKDGVDGKDGKDADTEEIAARVAELVMPRLAALIPPPIKGDKGDQGERGEDGFPSEDEIRSFVREEVNVLQRSFYQGVFRDGTNYTCAQAVTWDGSMWVATRDTTSKPGTDDSWQLAVKRGRDAKR